MSLFGYQPNSAQQDPYRKTNHRHWCPYCKLFISPTKSAILNHEKGDAHKANVQGHLNGLYKKKKEEQKAQGEMDKEIKKLMEAGERAYREKDLGIGKRTTDSKPKEKPPATIDPATGLEFHPYRKKQSESSASASSSTAVPSYNNTNYNYYAANYNNYNDYYNYNNAYYNANYNNANYNTNDGTSTNTVESADGEEDKEETDSKSEIKEESDVPENDEAKEQSDQTAVKQEYYPPPAAELPPGNYTGIGEWVTVSTKILSDDEDEDDDADADGDSKARVKRKRKQEESEPLPEPEREDTDDEDSRLRPVGYEKCTIDDKPAEPAVFKRVNTKQRNIRKK